MGNFIDSLGKGFIRSAVNQVGRDAGRVVSNQVYGDAHSIPHRNVSANSRIVDLGEKRPEGLQVIEPSTGKAIGLAIVGFLFSVIGGVVLLIVGFRKLKSKHWVYAWQYESQAVYVQDRRYKYGSRYDGDQLTRRKNKIEANDYEIEQNEKIAKIYLYTGFVSVIIYVAFLIASINAGN